MKNAKSLKSLIIATVAATAILAGIQCAAASEPKTHAAGSHSASSTHPYNYSRSGTYSSNFGANGKFSTTGQVQKNAWSKQQAFTSSNGQVYNRTVNGTYNKANNQVDTTVKGVAGNTYTSDSTYNAKTGTYNDVVKGSRGYTSDETYNTKTGAYTDTITGPKGNDLNIDGTAKDGHRQGTYSTNTGASGTYQSNLVSNGNGSYTRDGAVTTKSGQSYNYSNTSDYNAANKTVTDTYTGPAGHSYTGSATLDSQEGDQE